MNSHVMITGIHLELYGLDDDEGGDINVFYQ